MPEAKNSKNAYVCAKLHSTVTINKDEGTTPMFITCPECGERATSRMGQVNPHVIATWEWYKPTDAEVLKEATDLAKEIKRKVKDVLPGFQEHVRMGGLLMRKII